MNAKLSTCFQLSLGLGNVNECERNSGVQYGDAQEFGEILKDMVFGEGGVALVCVGMTQAEDVLQQHLVPPTGSCAKEAKEEGMSNKLPTSTKKTIFFLQKLLDFLDSPPPL